MTDFLSKLKSNMGSHAEDTSYSQSFTCYSEDEKTRKQNSRQCERSESFRSSPNVTLSSLKNIWSSSCDMPSFAEGGSVKSQAKKLASMGRDGDTELVHVNKDEEKLLKAYGGRGSINPKTGLREYPLADPGSSPQESTLEKTARGVGLLGTGLGAYGGFQADRLAQRGLYSGTRWPGRLGKTIGLAALGLSALDNFGKGYHQPQKLTGKDIREDLELPSHSDMASAATNAYIQKNPKVFPLDLLKEKTVTTGSRFLGNRAGNYFRDAPQDKETA